MKLKNSLLLLLTATIWGVAFVAQSAGMDLSLIHIFWHSFWGR